MDNPADDITSRLADGIQRPRCEPYVFTAAVMAAFVVLLIGFGFIARLPFFEPAIYIAMTLAAIWFALRNSSRLPSVAGNAVLVPMFALASLAYFEGKHAGYGVGYGLLAFAWLGISVRAFIVRRRKTRERESRLNHAVETLRGRQP